MTKLQQLQRNGQSVWLDYIRRDIIGDGELNRLVADGVRGLTSNPTIFQKAIATSSLYDEQIQEVSSHLPEASTAEVFEALALRDIRGAADALRPVYDGSGRADGFVSLEVDPHLASDTESTIAEAKRLWGLVDRPNLMIKVPATPEGVPALEQLIATGINVNATLMFSLDHYEAIARAFIRGVERAPDPAGIASVASFFVSRVDTKADAALEKVGTDAALALRGTIAVANAKLAYRRYQEIFEGPDFDAAAALGARPQRVLWASTSTKNPAYSDVLYVEELIGPNTVNTMPPATIEAFSAHGEVRAGSLTQDVHAAAEAVERLGGEGIDIDELTAELQVEGVAAFADSYDELLDALATKTAVLQA